MNYRTQLIYLANVSGKVLFLESELWPLGLLSTLFGTTSMTVDTQPVRLLPRGGRLQERESARECLI